MARGGRRVGTTGTKYTNRNDLRNGPRKPSTPAAAPAGNQPFGAQADQLRSLQALPLATQPNGPSTNAGPGVAVTGATPPPDGAAPGSLPPLNRPTDRPGEPVTAGSPSGPGPGPNALPQQPSNNISSFMAMAARVSGGDPTLLTLAQQAQALGQ